MNLREIKKLFLEYRIYPSKRLGQNFLIDEGVLKKIIESANLSKNDTILEIGPGVGNLTLELAKKVKKVIAIEKDERMIKILKESLECWDVKNVEIIKGDILKLDPKPYTIKQYKVVANIPYYLTSPLIRKFLETKKQPSEMILMVQKEVAQRICPCPPKLKERRRGKTPKMSLLAVSVQFYVQPKIISYVSKKSFWPQPKVDSAIIKIVSRQFRVPVSRQFRERFFRIVKAGFSQPRKQIVNNLSRLNFSPKNLSGQAKNPKVNREKVKKWLLKNNIQPSQRAESLGLDDWINLTKSCKL